MSDIPNPPAFARPGSGLHTKPDQVGMSLRDWFAGQALAGLCSQHDTTGMWSWTTDGSADEAYRIADAMLSARNAGTEA